LANNEIEIKTAKEQLNVKVSIIDELNKKKCVNETK